jgi:hypothetical protein
MCFGNQRLKAFSGRLRTYWMQEELLAQIKSAVASWARTAYDSEEIIIGMAAEDDIDDEEGTRFLVDYAVRQEGQWLVAEVWVEKGAILGINDLGEGLPLDNAEWPWPTAKIN